MSGTVRYLASCPGCGKECWWIGMVVSSPMGNQGCTVRVACSTCEVRDRERAAARLIAENSVRSARLVVS